MDTHLSITAVLYGDITLDATEPSPAPSRITSSPSPTPTPLPSPQPSPTQPSPTQPSPTQLSPTQPGSVNQPLTPYGSPLHAVHSHGSEEGSLKLQELMHLVNTLSDRLSRVLRKRLGKARKQTRVFFTDDEAFEDDLPTGRNYHEEVQEKASTETELFIQEVTPTEVIQDQEGSVCSFIAFAILTLSFVIVFIVFANLAIFVIDQHAHNFAYIESFKSEFAEVFVFNLDFQDNGILIDLLALDSNYAYGFSTRNSNAGKGGAIASLGPDVLFKCQQSTFDFDTKLSCLLKEQLLEPALNLTVQLWCSRRKGLMFNAFFFEIGMECPCSRIRASVSTDSNHLSSLKIALIIVKKVLRLTGVSSLDLEKEVQVESRIAINDHQNIFLPFCCNPHWTTQVSIVKAIHLPLELGTALTLKQSFFCCVLPHFTRRTKFDP
ncbi:hypothetical protein Tco_1093805 [Tanacetum coccineum]|uniref:Uncharacterized protein n=1 Tax=Tanacetum coccineum TaxID=301880 RepID=A0ABQ5IG59_9ASTR